jgi:deoxyribonuclease-4
VVSASLRFGTSGAPLSSARPGSVHGIRRVRELGLDHMEMAWGNGIRMSDQSAGRIAATAREHDVTLTAHAPYYVNLCGVPEVVERSLVRLTETARLGALCGAHSICFHPGFYGPLTGAQANARVRGNLRKLMRSVKKIRASVDVRTELTGKPTQVGSLEETLAWCRTLPEVRPCIDFSHRYAREQGRHNTYEEFGATLAAIEQELGRDALERLHIHIAGIRYGPRGERSHEPLRETAFRWKPLLRALKDMRVSGWVVCESPAMEDDALLLQKTYRRMK